MFACTHIYLVSFTKQERHNKTKNQTVTSASFTKEDFLENHKFVFLSFNSNTKNPLTIFHLHTWYLYTSPVS